MLLHLFQVLIYVFILNFVSPFVGGQVFPRILSYKLNQSCASLPCESPMLSLDKVEISFFETIAILVLD